MSTEQGISGAEHEALIKSFEGWTPFSDLPMADLAWVASRDYYKARFLEQNGKLGAAMAAIQRERDEADAEIKDLTHRLDIALESEVACAEQRQRADMAEEREKKLREGFRRSAERMHSLSEGPEHMGHVFNDCPHYACFEARGILDA